jgi:hypothetical protein
MTCGLRWRLAGRALVVAMGICVSQPALAQPADGDLRLEDITVVSDTPGAAEPVAIPAERAALPTGLSARHDGPRVIALSRGGYDGSTRTVVMSSTIEATVIDRVTLRAAVATDGQSTRIHPSGGVIIDVARQSGSGFDLAIGGEYDAEGFNRVPLVIARLAAGRTVGTVRVSANAALGFGTGDGERAGELELAALHAIAPRLQVGLDAHGAIDLERDADEPAGEPDWTIQAGPVATYALGRIAISAQAGVSAWKLRRSSERDVGAIGTLGLGLAF